MNPQHQNLQPDYSFITNQEQGVTKPPRKTNKKLVVVIVLLMLSVAVLVLGSLTNKTKNSVVEQKGDNSNNVVNQDTKNVVENYLTLIKEKKYEESRQILSQIPGNVSPELYDYYWGTFMAGKYDLQKCEVTAADDKSSKVFCPLKNRQSEGTVFVYTLSSTGDKIDNISKEDENA